MALAHVTYLGETIRFVHKRSRQTTELTLTDLNSVRDQYQAPESALEKPASSFDPKTKLVFRIVWPDGESEEVTTVLGQDLTLRPNGGGDTDEIRLESTRLSSDRVRLHIDGPAFLVIWSKPGRAARRRPSRRSR